MIREPGEELAAAAAARAAGAAGAKAVGAVGGAEAGDETVTVSRAGLAETVVVPREVRDETVVAPRREAPVDDATVAVPRAFEVVEDATVVVARSAEVVEDATVVVPRKPEATDSPTKDATVFVSRKQDVVEDATVMIHRPESTSEQISRSHSVGMPVEEPSTSGDYLRSSLVSLDPRRRIDPAPWQVQAEPGLRPGLPVAYGPRADVSTPLPAGAVAVDIVQQRIGPPPVTGPRPVFAERPVLPSTRRRARRSRVVTLASYVGVVTLSVIGLVIVVPLLFG